MAIKNGMHNIVVFLELFKIERYQRTYKTMKKICKKEKLNPADDFQKIVTRLKEMNMLTE